MIQKSSKKQALRDRYSSAPGVEREDVVPLVSICCITYNHADFIEQTLESMLDQETNFGVEILVHDDASTDGTATLLGQYSKKYPGLFKLVLQKENQFRKYPSGGRINPLFNYPRARGEFIAICEGDDYWTYSSKLALQVDELVSSPEVNLVFHDAIILNEVKRAFGFRRKAPRKMGSPTERHRQDSVSFTIEDIIECGWFIPTASIMVRTKCVQDMLTNHPWISYAGQGDYCLQLIAAMDGVVSKIGGVMSVYRRHDNGLTIAQGHRPLILVQALAMFNYHTEFKYDYSVQVKIDKLWREICGVKSSLKNLARRVLGI